ADAVVATVGSHSCGIEDDRDAPVELRFEPQRSSGRYIDAERAEICSDAARSFELDLPLGQSFAKVVLIEPIAQTQRRVRSARSPKRQRRRCDEEQWREQAAHGKSHSW